MKNDYNNNQHTQRENFLISLIHKVSKEYRDLLDKTRRAKPFKIIEIAYLSPIPGETEFIIQITNKNSILRIAADKIVSNGYDLSNFNDFHAEMIQKAAQGKLIEFLQLSETRRPIYKIVSKKLNYSTQQFMFTIETEDKLRFTYSAEELYRNKHLLTKMNIEDIYDVGYTQGSESVLKEKASLFSIKQKL